jgi:hypothetical protein
MLINYEAAKQGIPFVTDPGTLNTWLTANSQPYQASGSVYGADVVRYAQQIGSVPLFYYGRHPSVGIGRDDFTLDTSLCNGDPVIMQVPVKQSTHFVLATGEIPIGDPTTYSINDPGYNNSDLTGCAHPPNDCYGNTYLGLRVYSSNPTQAQVIAVFAHSPVELLMTDPNGNETGFVPTTGALVSQIPGSSYGPEFIIDDSSATDATTTPEVKILEVLTALPGAYTLQSVGTGAGNFTLDFVFYDTNGNPTVKSVNGNTVPGVINRYLVQYASTPGANSSLTAPCAADLNNDGVVNSLDLDIVKAAFGAHIGQPKYNLIADVNHDGVVDIKDLSFVARNIGCVTQIK